MGLKRGRDSQVRLTKEVVSPPYWRYSRIQIISVRYAEKSFPYWMLD